MIDGKAKIKRTSRKHSQVVYKMLMNVDKKILMQNGQDFACLRHHYSKMCPAVY